MHYFSRYFSVLPSPIHGNFIVYDNLVTELSFFFQTQVGAGLDPPALRYEGGTVKTVPYSP